MDIAQAASYLNIKKGTLYRLAKKGEVPGAKIGGQWRFKRDKLDEMFRLDTAH
ncbi:MAG: helix-turn-helix domain-containing protein, partial [Gemmatimonadota bacterium]|nr:helix-turn-helix domain-containing protein [Gemmatimonadota bacterium]